jgi:hypothetical protein
MSESRVAVYLDGPKLELVGWDVYDTGTGALLRREPNKKTKRGGMSDYESRRLCECGHLELSHLANETGCTGLVRTEAPIGGGGIIRCSCKMFSGACRPTAPLTSAGPTGRAMPKTKRCEPPKRGSRFSSGDVAMFSDTRSWRLLAWFFVALAALAAYVGLAADGAPFWSFAWLLGIVVYAQWRTLRVSHPA